MRRLPNWGRLHRKRNRRGDVARSRCPSGFNRNLDRCRAGLRAAEALQIYLAGEPHGEAAALRDADVVELICGDSDALGILDHALTVTLGERQR